MYEKIEYNYSFVTLSMLGILFVILGHLGCVSILLGLSLGFDLEKYKSQVYYHFVPFEQMGVYYAISSILLVMLYQKIQDRLMNQIRLKTNRRIRRR